MNIDILSRSKGCLLGLACGDAVGTTLEFSKPGSFPRLKDMFGGGPFRLNAGEWTDDTSMALCLGQSLLDKNGFDPTDQMEKYLKWYHKGYMSSNGTCFDIGLTVRQALSQFELTQSPYSGSTDPMSAGNGSLMRVAPIPIYYFLDLAKTIEFSALSSKTTHGADECIQACKLFSIFISRALQGLSKEEILNPTGIDFQLSDKLKNVLSGSYKLKKTKDIQGSGYVVESLEASLWAFYKSNSFEEAILEAVNLGRDADTTGAICGQIAGAFWGKSGIPEKWLKKLVKCDFIEDMALKLLDKEFYFDDH